MANQRGGARAGAGRKRGSQNQATRAAKEAARALPHATNPMAWLTALMADSNQVASLRIEAAKVLLPYVHAKKTNGIKNQKLDAAKQTSAGRFKASKSPVLVIS